MKKIFALAVAAFMCLGLAACGEKSTDVPDFTWKETEYTEKTITMAGYDWTVEPEFENGAMNVVSLTYSGSTSQDKVLKDVCYALESNGYEKMSDSKILFVYVNDDSMVNAGKVNDTVSVNFYKNNS